MSDLPPARPANDFVIAPAQAGDAQRAAAIMPKAFDAVSLNQAVERVAGPANGLAWPQIDQDQVRRDFADRPADCFVARLGKKFVGFAICTLWPDIRRGRIDRLAVDPRMRGCGIGRLLTDHMLTHFRSAGVNVARIEALTHNTVACRLYESMGFVEVARQVHLAIPVGAIPADLPVLDASLPTVPGTPEDAESAVLLTQEAFNGVSIDQAIENRFGVLAGRAWTQIKGDGVRIEFERTPEDCLVVRDAGRMLGYVTCPIDRTLGRGRIANLAVDRACRGKGVGRRLIYAALDRFRRAGLSQAKIETLAVNAVGQHLYPACGFVVACHESHYAMPLATDGSA